MLLVNCWVSRCASPSQINQVFLNILVNAAQAIDETGVIRIETQAEPKGCVTIRILDTGKGIDAQHLNNIFDPFFSH
ncbi:MAG: hypothetical protein GY807_08795 [Gammaproteobacteria bacterium]|nr:hypothetical protein [Gammaproteobacteria bacterium]